MCLNDAEGRTGTPWDLNCVLNGAQPIYCNQKHKKKYFEIIFENVLNK